MFKNKAPRKLDQEDVKIVSVVQEQKVIEEEKKSIPIFIDSFGPNGFPPMNVKPPWMPHQKIGPPPFGNYYGSPMQEDEPFEWEEEGGIDPSIPHRIEQGGPKQKKSEKPEKKPKEQVPKVKKTPKYLEKPVEKKKFEEKVDITKINQDLEIFHKVDETREPMNIVFIGHVDAGKSTLCGCIMLKTGMVAQDEMRKYESEAKQNNRESWVLAYIMDVNEEERKRGKTVEVAKTLILTKSKRFTLMDAPGHKNYVPNMISGASQADVACLVISVKRGEFESGFEKGGQTREHAMLAKSLGVSHLIVAINKMDESGWSEEVFKITKSKVENFLLDSCGYEKNKITFVPVAGLPMLNIDAPFEIPWYKGPCLLDALDQIPSLQRDNSILRIPILDKTYSLDKTEELNGIYVYGKIETGTIRDGMTLVLMPDKKEIVIERIYNVIDERVAYALPGENVKLKIKGNEDMTSIQRGSVICGLEFQCFVTHEFEAEVQILQLPETRSIMSDGYKCIMHLHIALEEVTVSKVLKIWDNNKGEYVKNKFLRSGSKGIVHIKTIFNRVCLEKFEKLPQLGAFTLRDESITIGTGKVMKIKKAQ